MAELNKFVNRPTDRVGLKGGVEMVTLDGGGDGQGPDIDYVSCLIKKVVAVDTDEAYIDYDVAASTSSFPLGSGISVSTGGNLSHLYFKGTAADTIRIFWRT